MYGNQNSEKITAKDKNNCFSWHGSYDKIHTVSKLMVVLHLMLRETQYNYTTRYSYMQVQECDYTYAEVGTHFTSHYFR